MAPREKMRCNTSAKTTWRQERRCVAILVLKQHGAKETNTKLVGGKLKSAKMTGATVS